MIIKDKISRNTLIASMCAAILTGTTGCAGIMPVPGGNETVNESFYETKEDLLTRLETITSGMTEKEVFAALDRHEADFQRLTRQEVVTALLGTSNVEFKDGTEEQNYNQHLLQSLYGFRLSYQIVKRKLGFSSPIRIRTDEKGFDYIVTLIFRDGVLFEKPILSGGVVNASTSKTFFDYLNPGTVMDRAIR